MAYPHRCDKYGAEIRERTVGEVPCPECGKAIPLTRETEEWHEDAQGKWRHGSYGPATGCCDDCGVLIYDSWDGGYAWHRPSEESTP